LSAALIADLKKKEVEISSAQVLSDAVMTGSNGHAVDMKLEVVVIPVADVERAAQFYRKLGWRVDADRLSGERRILQFTPPGSQCSIIFGTRMTPSAPGSAQLPHLVVSDIQVAREQLIQRGIDASEVFHDARGGYNRFDVDARASGLGPQRRSYASYLTFSDPDGNGWLLQEVTARLPGRIESGVTTFASVADLASALRRAEVAHGEHEKRLGQRDSDWPDWYAAYMAAEQTGQPPPS
jgi:catechol 2,3-dioxygenase-like lactoylglutathione lyase family enzyme